MGLFLTLALGIIFQGTSFSPPTLKTFIQARYPEEALKENLEGEVVLLLSVNEEGHVTSVKVQTPAGHGFDEAALEAVRQFEFIPAESEGVPVPVEITYRYAFVLKKQQELPVNFRGEVRERGTRNPVPGVTVSLPDLKLEATTNATGVFSFKGVTEGKNRVVAAGADYYSFETREEVRPGEVLTVKYYIRRRSYGGYETVVRGLKEEKEVTRRALSFEEIKSTAGTSGDAIRVVEDLPGMARGPYTGGILVVRGSAPQDTQVFVDGHPIPILYHFGGLTSTLNPEILRDIEFIPGGYSVRYGRGMGGIIEVKTRPAKTDRWHGMVGMDVFDAEALVEGPIAGGGFFASARRSYIDVFIKAVMEEIAPENELTLTVAPRYYDYQTGYNHRLDRGNTSFMIFGSDDELAFVTQKPLGREVSLTGEFSTKLYFHRIIGSWEQRIGEGITSEASASFGLDKVFVNVGDLVFLDTDEKWGTVREELPIRISNGFRLTPGIDLLFGRYDAEARVPPIPREGETPSGLDPFSLVSLSISGGFFAGAAFLEADIEPLDGLLFIPGIRADYLSLMETRAFTIDPRLAVRYRAMENLTAKGSVGLFHQPPLPPDLIPGYGNPDLEEEWAIQYTAGAEAFLTELVSLDAQLFFKDLNNLVANDSQGKLSNKGVGRAYGLELLLRRLPEKAFYGWVAYTLSKSERKDNPNDKYRPFSYDQTHILTLVANYKLPRDWEAGLRFRYVTGNPSTPLMKGLYDSDRDRYLPFSGEPLSERMPDFHQLDIRIDKKFVYTTWILDVYLDILNVYNRFNTEGYIYNYDYTERAPLTGLPIIPSIGVQAFF